MTHSALAILCLTCTLGLGGAAQAGSYLVSAPVSSQAESAPLAVTSDTLDYCRTLAHKVHHTLRQTIPPSAPMVNQAMYLEHEGEALCAHGHLRSGIAQERRALAVLRRS